MRYPKNPGLIETDARTHDFAIYVLKYSARWSATVQPICLPRPGQKFSKQWAQAAGWGRYSSNKDKGQSVYLRKVWLRVSTKKYKHKKMFGTTLEKNSKGIFKDPCAGDSGISCFGHHYF